MKTLSAGYDMRLPLVPWLAVVYTGAYEFIDVVDIK
jgi:hypothetical protein